MIVMVLIKLITKTKIFKANMRVEKGKSKATCKMWSFQNSKFIKKSQKNWTCSKWVLLQKIK